MHWVSLYILIKLTRNLLSSATKKHTSLSHLRGLGTPCHIPALGIQIDFSSYEHLAALLLQTQSCASWAIWAGSCRHLSWVFFFGCYSLLSHSSEAPIIGNGAAHGGPGLPIITLIKTGPHRHALRSVQSRQPLAETLFPGDNSRLYQVDI